MKCTILTPLPLELKVIQNHIIQYKEVLDFDYYAVSGAFKGSVHTFQITIIQTGSKNVDIALVTEKAIQKFKPDIVLLTGIAGGIKDVALLDVVVANKAYGYESGKITAAGLVSRPEVYFFNKEIVKLSESILRKADWKNRSSHATITTKAIIGPICSGEKVIASTQSIVYKNIKTFYNDCTGLEMEAVGFAKAMSFHPAIIAANIRGISDLLDEKNTESDKLNQPKAADNAAAFLFELLYQVDITKLNIPIMNTKELANKIFSILFPLSRLESVTDIGKELREATNTSVKNLWAKASPLFIEEFEELKATPKDEEVQGAVKVKLKRELGKPENELLKAEINQLLKEMETEPNEESTQSVVNSKYVSQVKGNQTIGGDFNMGNTTKTTYKETAKKKQEEPPLATPEPPSIEKAIKEEPLGINVLEQFTALKERLITLNTDFQSKLKYDSAKEKIIDKLHAELQTHKEGLIRKLLKPVFMDIINVIDDSNKMLRNFRIDTLEGDALKLYKIIKEFPTDLEDVLYRHGVDVVNSDVEIFDPSRQKVIKTEVTSDLDLDKKVVRKLKNGYSWEEKLIRHEMVAVYKYKVIEELQED